jgi:hypothetical protein
MSHTRTPPSTGWLRPARIAACLWLLVGVWFAPHAGAQEETSLEIRSARAELVEGIYQLDAALTLDLPPEARRAIEAGLTLRLEYEIQLNRVRRYMVDAEVATLLQSYELTYHAVSQRFLLRNLNTGEQEDYGTLESALAALTSISSLPVIDASLVESGVTYEARVRAIVDLSATPDALQWLLFWTDDWSSSSEWYSWTLRP